MAKRICDVTGVKTNTNNFYKNQSHIKAVDNIRRNTYYMDYYTGDKNLSTIYSNVDNLIYSLS